MTDTKISIVVPIYRVEPYLRKCLDSIVNQTYQNLEIILVDDGSPDNCGEICNEYAARDQRVKVIHQENGGVSSARNAGLAAATGDWLGWVDPDDWVELDMYEYLLEKAMAWQVDVAVCGRMEVYQDHQVSMGWERETILSREEAIGYLLEDGLLRNYLWDKLWRREIFRDIVFPVGRTFEDVAITYRLLEKTDKVVCLPKCKYFYLQRGDGIVRSVALGDPVNYYVAAKERYSYLKDQYPQFRGRMEMDLVSAVVRTWEVWALNSPQIRKQYREQVKDMASFCREHYKAALEKSQLGLAGRLVLRLTPHASPWAFALAHFVSWLYQRKHRWPL